MFSKLSDVFLQEVFQRQFCVIDLFGVSYGTWFFSNGEYWEGLLSMVVAASISIVGTRKFNNSN